VRTDILKLFDQGDSTVIKDQERVNKVHILGFFMENPNFSYFVFCSKKLYDALYQLVNNEHRNRYPYPHKTASFQACVEELRKATSDEETYMHMKV